MQKELQFAQGLGMPVRRMEHLPQQIKEQEPVAVRYLSAHPGVSEKDCCQEDGVWHIPSDYPDAEPDNFEMEVGMC